MKNIEALSRLCNAIANTFYPDTATLEFALFNQGVEAQAEAAPKDPEIFRGAVGLVKGYVESSRSEGGISTSVMQDAVEKSLVHWCNFYGLDVADELSDFVRVIDDGSNMW